MSFPEVWLQRGAAHGRAWNQTTLLEWHVSTNLHPVTLFIPSILPKGYLYFEKPQFWLRISKTIKSKHSLHPMQSETGVVQWYTTKSMDVHCPRNFQIPSLGPLWPPHQGTLCSQGMLLVVQVLDTLLGFSEGSIGHECARCGPGSDREKPMMVGK